MLSARPQGETAVLARLMTADLGLAVAYVAGGRGRRLRPVVLAGNLVEARLAQRGAGQLPFAELELVHSRGPLLAEPLPAAAIAWACALTSVALPERHPYPNLFHALDGVLATISLAPSARGWAGALIGYEGLLLRELGYGGAAQRPAGPLAEVLAAMDALAGPLEHYLLADRRGDVMAARQRLRDMLGRIEE